MDCIQVCRICLECRSDVLWHVSNELESVKKTVLWYILNATGVEVKEHDIIRTFCYACITVSINMYWFKNRAIKNDKLLKEKYGQKYCPPDDLNKNILTEDELYNLPDFAMIAIPVKSENDNNTVLKVESGEIVDDGPRSPEIVYLVESRIPDVVAIPESSNKLKAIDISINNSIQISTDAPNHEDNANVHTSVQTLLCDYPNLNIPDNLRICNINPVIELTPQLPEKSSVSKEFFTTCLKLAPAANTNYNIGENSLICVDKADDVFICNLCNHLTTSKRMLTIHKKSHHTHVCKICYGSFSKNSILKKHIQDHHDNKVQLDKSQSLQTYSVKTNEPLKLTIRKDHFKTTQSTSENPTPSEEHDQHNPDSIREHLAEKKAETDYVKYLLVNRYVHKTQLECQTDFNDTLEEPICDGHSVIIKGIKSDLDRSKIKVKLKVGPSKFKGSLVYDKDEAPPTSASFDFDHICPTNIVPVSNPYKTAKKTETKCNEETNFNRKRSRTKSCDSRTSSVQNSTTSTKTLPNNFYLNTEQCPNGTLNSPGSNSEDYIDLTEEPPKKIRVKDLWEINC